jgi:hypothetical protein
VFASLAAASSSFLANEISDGRELAPLNLIVREPKGPTKVTHLALWRNGSQANRRSLFGAE